ncbi:TPA: AAA family ATPase [Klebsiella pneumoniae]|nr:MULTISPECIES: AAA family ATPase [Klebsiella]HDS5635669.1 AAA family ATPase [Klebsiella pneumoniae subsp. pneumoniae]EIV7286767.1 AAA family ATPase [Klebsiella pneumoniae]MCC5462809.1 AAA family ATPase [Klebsiella quasipneumoniae subsp. similipneumoniae]MCQ0510940.1 AAA family ATPase [Klebsiella pneumoniae]MCS4422018.1 AAA family ATPase [Klebsiella quasipneumoniae subsp. similipneumoniae]
MIESISLSNIATYHPDKSEVISLKKINFIYGANGAGKTTISRLIEKPSLSIDSSITWLNNTPVPAMVYNNDFITANFSESKEFQGVFTLGKAEKVQLDRLKELKDERKRHEQLRAKLIISLDGEDGKPGKNAELISLEAKLVGRCWEQKVKHDEYFKGAFAGLRNNKEAFKAKVLQEHQNNKYTLVDLVDLKTRATVLYGDQPSKIDLVSTLDLSRLIAFEKNPILVKKVVGKDDVSISAIIQRLGNSDWVRQGMRFMEHTDEQCPFCQQILPHDFEKELTDYFDETFEADSKAVSTLRNNYFQIAEDLLAQAYVLLALDCKELDKEQLTPKIQALDAVVLVNKGRMDNKVTTPSTEVFLEGLEDIQADITAIINAANAKISEQNRLVASFTTEQRRLTGEVWKYIIDAELKNTLSDYTTEKNKLQKSISGITLSRDKATESINATDVDIDKIEAELTSVKPTVIAINKILKNFGFLSFSLDPACIDNSYRIIRADGKDAKQTLSEGEKTFVTFLYFYHLLRGSITTSGITTDRIVIIDDPVSSLDSDVLFIVSSLIKELFAEVRKGDSHLKQVVVLTHNVHFHKEVTYDQRRKTNTSLADETFWIVRKPNEYSVIEFHSSNPIRNSYQLLWAELKRTPVPVLTLQNTMRRILENYFKILGGVDTYHLVDKFEGIEKIHCQSLMSWVNDGSHYAPDELYVAISDNMAANYLKIFFKIFKAAKHDAHYKMMMGDSYVDLDPEDISEQQPMTTVGEEGNTVFDGAAVKEPSTPVPTALKSEIDQSGFDQVVPF